MHTNHATGSKPHVPLFQDGKRKDQGECMNIKTNRLKDIAQDHVVILLTSGSGTATLGLGVRRLLPHGNTKRSNVLGGKEVQDGPRGNTDDDLQAAGIQVDSSTVVSSNVQ